MKKHRRKDCPYLHVQKCPGCGRSCSCHRGPSAKQIASARLDRAATAFTAEQLMMNLSFDDPGDRARSAWLELQRAARAFVKASKKRSKSK